MASLEELEALEKSENGTKVKMFDLTDDVIVQGEYSIGEWSSLDPQEMPPECRSPRTIRTFGVGPCVVLALHNDYNFRGALFHIDSVGQLNRRIREPIAYATKLLTSHTQNDRFQGKPPKKPKAKLIGGINNTDSKRTVVGIHECLRPEGIEIEGQRILQNQVYYIVFDLFTGKLFSYNPQIDQQREDFKGRLLAAQINLSYGNPLVNIAPQRRID